MKFLPGHFEEFTDSTNWSQAQKITYLSLDYLLMAMYAMLILLVVRNIWAILMRQGEYKNIPILAFYVFALLAVSIRLLFIIGEWTDMPIFTNMDFVQQGAKLSVGIVQDWITFELAIRMHKTRGYYDISEAAKNRLHCAFGLLLAGLTLAFLSFSLIVIISARKPEHSGYAF